MSLVQFVPWHGPPAVCRSGLKRCRISKLLHRKLSQLNVIRLTQNSECSPPPSRHFCLFASQKFELGVDSVEAFWPLSSPWGRINEMRSVCLVGRLSLSVGGLISLLKSLRCGYVASSVLFFALFHSAFSLCILFTGPVCLSLRSGRSMDESLRVDADATIVYRRDARAWLRSVEESAEGRRGQESSAAISLAANGTRCSLLKLVTPMHTGLLFFVLYVNVMAFFSFLFTALPLFCFGPEGLFFFLII